jgi:hypothetical protein
MIRACAVSLSLLLINLERACPFVGSHKADRKRKEAHEGKRQLRIIDSFLHARVPSSRWASWGSYLRAL